MEPSKDKPKESKSVICSWCNNDVDFAHDPDERIEVHTSDAHLSFCNAMCLLSYYYTGMFNRMREMTKQFNSIAAILRVDED